MRPIEPGRVIVVGAGITGLALAGELALAGVACRVLDRRLGAPARHRLVGLSARAMEVLDLRGQADRLRALARPVDRVGLARVGTAGAGPVRAGTGARDLSDAPDPGPPRASVPRLSVVRRDAVEAALADWVRGLGAEIIRAAEVTDLVQDRHGVTVHVRGERGDWRERAAYVVGCDGVDSTVRARAGIPIRHGSYAIAAFEADLRLARPPAEDVALCTGPAGALFVVGDGAGRHTVTGIGAAAPDSPGEPAVKGLGEILRQMAGQDLGPGLVRWTGRPEPRWWLATRFRHGRVLLAGPGAYGHRPVGELGAGIGGELEDAVNLGWKLAGAVQGWAPPGLLDSYASERGPVAERVIRASDAAIRALTGQFAGRRRSRLRAGRVRSPGEPDLAQWLADVSRAAAPAGYAGGLGGGALAGWRAPDIALVRPDGARMRLHQLLRDGRFALVDLGSDAVLAPLAVAWPDRVRPLVADAVEVERFIGLAGLLVRPDGYVAWSAGAGPPAAQAWLCRAALSRWLGPGRDARPAGRWSPSRRAIGQRAAAACGAAGTGSGAAARAGTPARSW